MPREFVEDEARICFAPPTFEQNPGLVNTWTDLWVTYPGTTVCHEAASWVMQDDVLDRISDIDLPALVVHGEKDEAVSLESALAMASRLQGAHVVRVPDVGHTVNLEAPEVVNEAITDFVHSVYPGNEGAR
jgi:pimeloyl-ACP methyl ester carboxylesterase